MEIERVIREVTVRGQVQNMDQVARAYDQVSASSERNVVVFEKNARAAQSVDRELEKLRLRYQEGYREQQRYIEAQETYRRAVEQGRMTQAQASAELAVVQQRLEGTTRAQLEMTRAANDNARAINITGVELASTANHLKVAAVAAYAYSPAFRALVNPAIATATTTAMRTIPPVALAAGGAIVSAMSPALAFVSRIALPIYAVVKAIEAMNAIAELGAQKMKELVEISERSGAAGVSTDFFQRQTLSAEKLHVKIDDVAGALKRFNEITSPQLGGSSFEQRLAELQKWGNFTNNAGVAAFRNAASAEERYRAVVQLISTAMEQGERLAALDLAARFLPPDLLERLKANGNLLREMQETADRMKAVDIVPIEQVGYANELKRRLEDAEKVIANGLKPIQKDLTQLGLNYQESWVNITEWMAWGVTKANELYSALKAIPDLFASAGNWPIWSKLTEMSQKYLPKFMQGSADPLGAGQPTGANDPAILMGAGSSARTQLTGWLNDAMQVQNAMKGVYEITSRVQRDLSKGPPAAAKETKDALDRTMESVEKYIQVTEAAAKTIGASVYEQQKQKTIAELTASAMRAGVKDIASYAAEFEKLGDRAGQAAQALALARVQDQIKFDREMLSLNLSSEDVQIAQQLRGAYGSVAEALRSSEAEQMRLNNSMREGRDIVSGFGQDLLGGLLRGEDAMKAFGNTATNVIQRLASANLKNLMNGGSLFGNQNLMSGAGMVGMASAGLAGYQSGSPLMGALGGALAGASFGPLGMIGGGILGALGGLFGGNSQRREQERQRAAQLAQQNAQERASLDLRGNLIGLDQSTREGAVRATAFQQQAEYAAAVAAGSQNLLQMQEVHRREMEQLNKDWDKREAQLEEEKRAAEEAARKAALARQQAWQDKIFELTNDSSTEAGQLLALQREYERARRDEADLGGQAMLDIDSYYAIKRLSIIDDFAKAAVEAEQKAAKEREDLINRTARNILDYVNGLQTGSGSTLSPQDRLNAAQSVYNATLAQAQAGNADAQGRITQEFENLRQAARDMYGSSQAYQSILTAGINQLLALPAVQQTTDPLLVAMRDVLTAVQGTTSAVTSSGGSTVTAVNNNTTSTNQTVSSASAQEQALLSLQNSIANTNNSYQLITNSLLDAIRSLNETSRDHLNLMKSQLTGTFTTLTYTWSGGIGHSAQTTFTVNNNMLDALNKIVGNTHAIAANTASTSAILGNQFQRGYTAAQGILADGGRIGGRPHSQGGTMIEAELDEFMIRRSSAQRIGYSALDYMNRTGEIPAAATTVSPSRVRTIVAGNDNAAVGDLRDLVNEIRELRAEVARLRAENNRGNVNVATEVREGFAASVAVQAESNKMRRRQAS